MMAITHAAIGAAASAFALSPNPWVIGLAIAGSQLPDIDTSQSWVGSVFFPVSRWIEARYPHRTITHSLLVTVVLLLLAVLLWLLLPDIGAAWFAIPIGHATACFADTFTKQGVQLFYPKPVWCVCGANPNRRLTTGSVGEYFVLCAAVALLVFNLQFFGSGGWVKATSQAFGLREGAIQLYNEKAGEHHIAADIKGVWSSDRTQADGRYWVIALEGKEFVITDGQGIYKTGANILAKRVSTKPEAEAKTMTRTATVNDEAIVPILQQLQQQFSAASVYVSGSITVDSPEDIKTVISPNQVDTLTVAGGSVTLKHCTVETAISQLSGQYATGTLTAKIITPKLPQV